MRRHARATAVAATATTALVAGLALTGAPAATADPTRADERGNPRSDTRGVGPDYNNGKALPFSLKKSEKAKDEPSQGPSQVGDSKLWLANDSTPDGGIYLKNYTLRGVGEHIEVWVANDTAFPAGDCRNDLGLTVVTDAQVDSFIAEFDSNIYPKESAAFSVAPERDGKHAILDDLISSQSNSKKKGETRIPPSYWQGDGDNTVVLVDNVRDENFYAPGTPDGQTYIAGFFYSIFNEYHDRNIMTIDAFDWLHRTGTNPPDDSADPEYVECAAELGQSRPYGAPRPLTYEGTFAHEYQHLLMYYADVDETSWVNEGLADWAQTLVGYVDPSVSPDSDEADGHIACFQGYMDPSFGGPENSLTMWGDQGGPEILCDYGAAYTFMEYLHSRFGGDQVMTLLHNEPANGLDGLQNVLDQLDTGADAQQVLHDWLAMSALDAAIDAGAAGADPERYTAETLSSKINWDNPQAYDSEGAPPNGADFVRLPSELSSVGFSGAAGYVPDPVKWSSVEDPEDGEDLVLFSGRGDEIDHSAVVDPGDIEAGDTLTFDVRYLTEELWDFFFVQASTDGGATWESLPLEGTTSEHDPGAYPTVQSNVPGFTGDSEGWVEKSYDLSAFAGDDLLLNFRYVTDWAETPEDSGVWIDDVAVGGTALLDGTTIDGLRSMTEVSPVAVDSWTVQVVAFGEGSWVGELALTQAEDGSWQGALTDEQLASIAATGADTVAALVTANDPTESARAYPRYTLTANGEVMPGGGAVSAE